MGTPKIGANQCTYNEVVTAPSGETYQPTIVCGPYPPGSQSSPFTAWGLFFLGVTNVP